MSIGSVDGVVDEGFDGIGDGLDHEPEREDADPDPVVRLQPLPEEGNGEKAAPDDWCAPKKSASQFLRHLCQTSYLSRTHGRCPWRKKLSCGEISNSVHDRYGEIQFFSTCGLISHFTT